MNILWKAILPVTTKSEINIFSPWQRYRRFKAQEKSLKQRWLEENPQVSLPCTIRMVRISPRVLDDDNLQTALKHVRDVLADLLIPGLARGRADNDPRIRWEYEQKKGTMSLEITIYRPPS